MARIEGVLTAQAGPPTGLVYRFRWGLRGEKLLALPTCRAGACFSDVDRLVLDDVAAMSGTPVAVPDELFDGLAQLR